MKKILLTIFSVLLMISVAFLPLIQSSRIDKLDLNFKEIEYYLGHYGLNKKSTIGDFKQLLYNLVTKQEIKYPALSIELKNDIETLSAIFRQIGINDDISIIQALPIIEENSVLFRNVGINLFCVLRIYGHPARGLPYFRLLKCLCGIWYLFYDWPEHYVKINSLLIGLQYCVAKSCEDTRGVFIGLITFFPPAIWATYLPITPYLIINGMFTLFSKSNVPFID
jgi:hypothetical protein